MVGPVSRFTNFDADSGQALARTAPAWCKMNELSGLVCILQYMTALVASSRAQ